MNFFLFLALCLLKIGDFFTTYVGIRFHGAKEANPVGSWMFKKFGMGFSFLIDSIVLFPFSYYISSLDGPLPTVFLLTGCALQLVVDISNFRTIIGKKKEK